MSKASERAIVEDFLSKTTIAEGCSAIGTENLESRGQHSYCHLCKTMVYDLTYVSDEEIVKILEITNNRPCLKAYRMLDGRVKFKNCLKDRIKINTYAIAWTIVYLLSGYLCINYFSKVATTKLSQLTNDAFGGAVGIHEELK